METVILFLLLLVYSCPFALADVSGSQTISAIYYRADGNLDNSFYPQNDTDYLYDGTVSFDDAYKNSQINGTIQYRATDDRFVDNRDFSLERLSINLTADYSEINIGDYGAFLSEYSLNNAIKGVHIRLGDLNEAYFRIIGGIDTTRWEDFWEQRQDDSALRKYVTGFQLGSSFIEHKLKLNINYGTALNDKAYLVNNSAQQLINVVSLSGLYNMYEWLSMNLEFAKSFVDEDRNRDEIKTTSDSALKLGFDLNNQYYSLSSIYSRVSNDFQNTSGFISSDVETLGFDGILFLPVNTQFTHYLHLDRDNLSKQELTTSHQLNLGAGLDFSFSNGYAANLAYDVRKSDTTDKAVNERTDTYTVALSKDLESIFINTQYMRFNIFDKVNREQERKIDVFSLSLDGSKSIKDILFAYNFEENISHEKYCDLKKSDISFVHLIGVRADFPSSLYCDLKLNISDNDYHINDYDNDLADYSAELGYFIKDNLQLSFAYEHRGYSYADPDNNYSETKLTGSLSYQF